MKEHIVTKAYAKSLYQLGQENGINVVGELVKINELINRNNDLEKVLFIDVFSVDEKIAVINEVMNRLEISSMVKNFLNFLIQEKRINLFPVIFKDIVVIDDDKKGFLRGIIEGAEDHVDEEFFNRIKDYLKKRLNKKVRLDYQKNEKTVAGYRVTVGDVQMDVSLDNQLARLKDDILNGQQT